MSNKELPMLPFFPQDFLTATQSWRFPERGAYALLLFYQWILDDLPNDPEKLARLVGVEFHEFQQLWETVSSKFQENERGDKLFNARLEEYRADAYARKEAKGRGAQAANAKRWAGHIPKRRSHAQAIAQRVARASQDSDSLRVARASPPSPSPSPSPSSQQSLLGENPPSRGDGGDVPKKKARKRPEKREPDPEFLDFKVAYPERSGTYRWNETLGLIHTRLKEGHTWKEIIEGAQRYCAYVKANGKFGTEYVMQPATFVGPDKCFQNPWRVPPEAAPKRGYQTFDEWHAAQKLRADTPGDTA